MNRDIEEMKKEYRIYCIKQFFMDLDNLIDSQLMTFEEFKKSKEKGNRKE
jgi:hypothetical protein